MEIFRPKPAKNPNETELCPEIQLLMDNLEAKYSMGSCTLLFEDSDIESEYQHYYHRDTAFIYSLYIAFILLLQTIFTTFQVINFVTARADENFVLVQILNALHLLISLGHFIISRYKISWSIYFTSTQSLVLLVFYTEISIINNYESTFQDGFILIPMILMVLAGVSYCQKQLFIAYIIAWLLMVISTYFWVEGSINFWRQNFFTTLLFAIIFVVSRWSCWRDRNKFKQERNQKLLLQMFGNLIGVFHDGIIIAQADQIAFTNKQVNQIFEVKEEKLEEHIQDLENGCFGSLGRKESLIDNLKLAYPRSSQNYLETVDNQNFDYNNLWEYMEFIQRLHSKNVPGEHVQRSLDGSYFKLKKQDSRDGEINKKLQVFSQMISLGHQKMVMVTIRDMSQWLELERQKNITETKTIAFASAAHEFRNPLNGIIQSLDLLNDKVDLRKGAQCFTVAKNCTKLMLFLVNDILDYAQFESKQIVLNYEMVDLIDTIEQCIDVMIFQANAKKIKLLAEFNQYENMFVYTDKNRLRQILVNLMSNAIKYTQKGHVKVFIQQEDANLIINIEDTGVGISEEDQMTLFAPFTKIKNNRNLNKQGCGLGLTISKSLASALGADITLRSTKGVGTTFSIVLAHPHYNNNDQRQMFPIQDSYREKMKDHFDNTQKPLIEEDTLSRHKDYSPSMNLSSSPNVTQLQVLDTTNVIGLEESFQHVEETLGRMHKQAKKKFMPKFMSQQMDNLLIKGRKASSPSNKQELDNHFYEHSHESSKRRCMYFTHKDVKKHSSKKILQEEICKKVLIVDDESFNIMPLEGMLEARGVLCDAVYNGLDALDMIKENSMKGLSPHLQYNLIITDNQMPMMTGLELAQQIRQIEMLEGNQKKYKLALLSGLNTNQMEHLLREKNLPNGVFDFVLEKPLSEQRLLEILIKCGIKYQEKINDSLSFSD